MKVRLLPSDRELSPAEAQLRFTSELPSGVPVKAISIIELMDCYDLSTPGFHLPLIEKPEVVDEITIKEITQTSGSAAAQKFIQQPPSKLPCWIALS